MSLLMCVVCAVAFAQDYSIQVAGQAEAGYYFVTVTTILDKKQNKTALDHLRRLAVEGVMFRGVASAGGHPSQPALVRDPYVRTSKAEFFEAFNRERQYLNFVELNPESVVVTSLPKKKFEVTGKLSVKKDELANFLQQSGIIQTLNNLW